MSPDCTDMMPCRIISRLTISSLDRSANLSPIGPAIPFARTVQYMVAVTANANIFPIVSMLPPSCPNIPI